MIYKNTIFKGAYVVEVEKKEDERGFFARVWDAEELKRNGLNSKIVQSSISFNKKRGTIRGIHYQAEPFSEDKFVRVTKGAAYYVMVDIRNDSETFKKHFGIELSSDNHFTLYVPKGIALGFVTLKDNTEIYYQMSQVFVPNAARGIRWDDPELAIKWPLKPVVISEKDNNLPYFS